MSCDSHESREGRKDEPRTAFHRDSTLSMKQQIEEMVSQSAVSSNDWRKG